MNKKMTWKKVYFLIHTCNEIFSLLFVFRRHYDLVNCIGIVNNNNNKVIKGTHVSPYKYLPRTPIHETAKKQDRMAMLDERREEFDYDPERDEQEDLEFN